MTTRRLVFALDLVADAALIAAYRDRHAAGAVWPDVIRDIRDRGFVDMEIWQVADRLVMIAEVAEDFPRAADPALQPIVAEWEAQMDTYQRPIRAGVDKWLPMERIFALAEQSR
ncbi:L-rhamnose mutarotase [Sphingomonas floccifaciens]|uniref:L-rhamnose mutarotase n=1 Tax=Sphingomonas floccifaciens TaxID=1844115 RepID=A0ABW4NI03_9SPHN